MAGFGGTIKLTGEQAYRQALKAIAADLKTVAAEQKLTANTYDKTDNSITALAKRSDDLKNKLDAQKAKWTTLSNAIKDYESQQSKNKAVIQNVQAQLEKEKAKLEEIARQYGKNSKEYQDQAKVVNDLEQQLKELNVQYDKNETTLKTTRAALTSTEADMKKTGNEMQKLGKQAQEAGVSAGKLGLSFDNAGDAAKKANEGFTVMKGVLANLASQVISKAVEGFKTLANNIYEAGSNFDAAMSKVGAVSGATGGELDKLTEKAKEMGATTKFSASEAAEAFNYMAMAGWKTEDMLGGIEGVLNLAAAAGADLATTSDIVTDALTAMGYSAKDAGRLADVMAAASSNANTNVEMMGHTFQYAAPIIGAMGYNMEDAAVAIGLMANAGIKADKAGTALRSVLTRLAAPPKECATAMKTLGISLTDSSGKMKSLDDVMVDLRKGFSKLSETQQTQYAKSIAGAEAMSGLLAIVNASETDFNKLTQAVANSSGAAEKMAKTMQNNVAGKMTQLKSQLEGVYITIWEKVEPAITKAISSISNALKNVNWEQFGRKAKDALSKLVDGFTWLLEHGDLVVNAIKGILTAFVVTKVVNFTTSIVGTITALGNAIKAADGFAGAIGGIGKAISANPFGLLIGAIAGVGTAIYSVISSMNDGTDAASEYAEKLNEQTEAVNTNKESWQELKKTQEESLSADMTQLANIQTLKDELLTLVDANGKVKEGYEGRAAFILGTLNEALGTEYKMTDGVIQKYGELQKTIDQVIEKKKAEAIINAQQALYEEAITKQAEAYQRLDEIKEQLAGRDQVRQNMLEELELMRSNNEGGRFDMRILRLQKTMGAYDEETANLKNNYETQLNLLDEYAYNKATYEDNMAKFHEGKYDEMTSATWKYNENLKKAGDDEKSKLAAQNKVLQTELNHKKQLKEKNNTDIYDNDIKSLQKQIEANKQKMNELTSTTEKGLDKNKVVWSDSLAKNLSDISGKDVEFKKAGDKLVQMYVDGVKVGEPKTKKEITKMMNEQIKEMRSKNKDADKAGQYVIDGVNSGVSNQSKQSGAFRAIQSFGNSLLSRLRASLQEHSPSKATEEMGSFLLQGLGNGIKKEQSAILKQASNFGLSVIGAMNEGLGAGVDTSIMSNLQSAIPSEFSTNMSIMGDNAMIAQESQFSGMVGAFKEALAQMKIEMDDREMGSFVDKTVTKLVYN